MVIECAIAALGQHMHSAAGFGKSRQLGLARHDHARYFNAAWELLIDEKPPNGQPFTVPRRGRPGSVAPFGAALKPHTAALPSKIVPLLLGPQKLPEIVRFGSRPSR